MSDILDFKAKVIIPMKITPTSTELAKQILTEFVTEADNIKDIIIFVKFKDDEVIISHSGPTLSDKALAVQLIQHDIQSDISGMNFNE